MKLIHSIVILFLLVNNTHAILLTPEQVPLHEAMQEGEITEIIRIARQMSPEELQSFLGFNLDGSIERILRVMHQSALHRRKASIEKCIR